VETRSETIYVALDLFLLKIWTTLSLGLTITSFLVHLYLFGSFSCYVDKRCSYRRENARMHMHLVIQAFIVCMYSTSIIC